MARTETIFGFSEEQIDIYREAVSRGARNIKRLIIDAHSKYLTPKALEAAAVDTAIAWRISEKSDFDALMAIVRNLPFVQTSTDPEVAGRTLIAAEIVLRERQRPPSERFTNEEVSTAYETLIKRYPDMRELLQEQYAIELKLEDILYGRLRPPPEEERKLNERLFELLSENGGRYYTLLLALDFLQHKISRMHAASALRDALIDKLKPLEI